MTSRLVFFDLETGGLDDAHPDIQLAAVATEGLVEVDSFEAKISFDEADADPEALAVNHYDRELWRRTARPEREVVMAFSAFLRQHAGLERVSRAGNAYRVARLAGHNVLKFDAPRLSRMFARHEQFLPADAFRPADTLQLALWHAIEAGIEPENFQLSTLCAAHGIDTTSAHDALADVRMCVMLSKALHERTGLPR